MVVLSTYLFPFVINLSVLDLSSLYMLDQMAKIIRPVVLGLILCASHGRTFSLVNGYSAPLTIYKHLEYHDDAGAGELFFSNCHACMCISVGDLKFIMTFPTFFNVK